MRWHHALKENPASPGNGCLLIAVPRSPQDGQSSVGSESAREPVPDGPRMMELVRRHDALAQLAVGFGISVGTAYAYSTAVIDLLADCAPGLLKVLRETDPDFVLLHGTLAECDRVGDGQADYSAKHRRHGVNVQVVTDPAGQLLWWPD